MCARVFIAGLLASLAAIRVLLAAPPDEPETARPPEATAVAPDAFAALQQRYGAPRVLVEAARPAHPTDREAAATLVVELTRLGFEGVSPTSDRITRTDVADRAVAAGVDPLRAMQALEARPDFRLRVTVAESSTEESVYGIPMIRCEVHVRIDATCIGDHRPLPMPGSEATRRSRDGAKARAASMAAACASCAATVARSLREAWVQLGSGAAGRIVEVDGALDPLPAGDVRVLESVAGVRSVLRIGPADGQSPSRFGAIVLERPGYVLVLAPAGPAVPVWALPVAAGALLAGGTAILVLHRSRNSR